MKGHIHAENMRLYAEDAAETNKPWERWEFCSRGTGGWRQVKSSPTWSAEAEYRRKPRTININGFEVPEPLRELPKNISHVWCVDFSEPDTVYQAEASTSYVSAALTNTMAHTSREAAEIHAEALMSFTAKPE